MNKTISVSLLCIVSLFLFFWVFQIIDYLSANNFIKFVESFTSGESQTINLPLTTTHSCQNFCAPTARCAVTGQQCMADSDCPGCQPYAPTLSSGTACVPGANDAGKMTAGVTPQYSTLTSGYGTDERIISNDAPAQANFGPKTWLPEYEAGKTLFDQRYKPGKMEFMPSYPSRYTATGEFVEDGPLAANY